MRRAKTLRRQVFALALRGDIGLMRRRTVDRVLPQLVGRPERIEHQAGIGQQIFARPPASGPSRRERPTADRLGEIGNSIEAALLQQLVDLALPQPRQARRAAFITVADSTWLQHRAGSGVPGGSASRMRLCGRHGFSWRNRSGPRRGWSRRSRIVQHGMDLGIARHAIEVPFVEIDDRPGLAQQFMGRDRDRQRNASREGIDAEKRDAAYGRTGCAT